MSSCRRVGLRLPSAATTYRARTCRVRPFSRSVRVAVTPSWSSSRLVTSVRLSTVAPSSIAFSRRIGSSTSWLMNTRTVLLNPSTPSLSSFTYVASSLPASDSTATIPPLGWYVFSDAARTVSSSPTCRSISVVPSWKWPARAWIAVPVCRSTASDSTPWCPSSIAVVRPTRLPPTIRTGTYSMRQTLPALHLFHRLDPPVRVARHRGGLGAVEPGVQERPEALARDLRGEGDVVRGRGGLAGVAAHPGALDLLEPRVTDLLAQRIEHERAAGVLLRAEQVPEVAALRLCHRLDLLAVEVGLLVLVLHHAEERVGHAGSVFQPAVLGGIAPLVIRRMALVEPHVAPFTRRDAVAEPLVRGLVQHRGRPEAEAALEHLPVEDRERLRPQGGPDRRADHERAIAPERIGADTLCQPGELVDLGRELVGDERLQRGRDHVADADAGVDAAVDDLVAADGELDQLGRHRLALLIDQLRAPVRGRLRFELAVGDRRLAGRDVEVERERRLVARVVVGRQEHVGAGRLPERRRPVGRDDEGVREDVALARLVRVRLVIRDRDDEGLALRQRLRGRAGEVLTRAREPRRLVVHRHAADAVAGEVEVEARQRLRRVRGDRHRAVDPLRGRGGRVAQRDVVVLDVVAAVPQRREQPVADAGGARRRTVGGACGRRQYCKRRRGEEKTSHAPLDFEPEQELRLRAVLLPAGAAGHREVRLVTSARRLVGRPP